MIIFISILLVLVVYHHLGYPLLLKLFSNLNKNTSYYYGPLQKTDAFPSIHIVIPAFNEEDVIQQKINSISWLDYPEDRLSITIYCDGCTDETVSRALKGQRDFLNRDLDLRIVVLEENRGKVAIINRAIAECKADLIAFSDASAILSNDTLLRSVQHFINRPNVAVVTGDYSLLIPDNVGEQGYWLYQNKVRSYESKLGAVMGVTGAYYMIRREYCSQIEEDSINDDFIIPMKAVENGGISIFDHNIKILETEPTPLAQDALRRRRISQGNLQQVFRLKGLLTPFFNGDLSWQSIAVSWMFLSGKFLRVLMPYLLVMIFVMSIYLSITSTILSIIVFSSFLLLGQVSVYLVSIIYWLKREKATNGILNNKVIKLLGYLCQGHLMGLIGSASYLQKICMQKIFKQEGLEVKESNPWQKVPRSKK